MLKCADTYTHSNTHNSPQRQIQAVKHIVTLRTYTANIQQHRKHS